MVTLYVIARVVIILVYYGLLIITARVIYQNLTLQKLGCCSSNLAVSGYSALELMIVLSFICSPPSNGESHHQAEHSSVRNGGELYLLMLLMPVYILSLKTATAACSA